MARRAGDTKRRLFEAATHEFRMHGIAGARIDRIAASAGANKQLIYAYFGSKRKLFEAVVSEHVARILEEVPFDAADLPSHAAGLFEFYTAYPEVAELGTWHALEPGESEHRIPVIEDAVRSRARAIARAQADGLVDRSIKPGDLLALVNSLARTWAVAAPELVPRARPNRATLVRRREAVREAVRRLVIPASTD
jgi:AcrR family transcriptional regulator